VKSTVGCFVQRSSKQGQRSGPVPDDIDLLVIGDTDRHALANAVAEAESVLRREVNIRRVTAAA